jgi:HEAT repeat protein
MREHERELVQRLAVKSERLEAMRALVGPLTATEMRRSTTKPETFAALVEGLDHPHPQVRYWCVALLDHLPDRDIVDAVAPMLDDPVPRVRRMTAHALGCTGCRPACPLVVPQPVVERLAVMAETDPNAKVRMEAGLSLRTIRAAGRPVSGRTAASEGGGLMGSSR